MLQDRSDVPELMRSASEEAMQLYLTSRVHVCGAGRSMPRSRLATSTGM